MRSAASVLVLGAGSIGCRHARNLLAAGAEVRVADPEPGRAAAVTGASPMPFHLDDLGRFDGVVVASPTVHHAEQARAALDAGVKVLVEKPFATTTAEGVGIAESGRSLMVAFNLRFHAPVRRLRELTDEGRAGEVKSGRFWFGSYLPDWRPGTDYRTSYSARRQLGGGVLLDAIHELDLAVWWFGDELDVVGSVVSRLGHLEIDVEDTVKALLVAPSGVPVEISLDYTSRRYRRGIEIIGDEATLRLDWARQVTEIETSAGIETLRDETPVSRSYELQTERFLAWLADEAEPEVDGPTGLASLRLADEIRTRAR